MISLKAEKALFCGGFNDVFYEVSGALFK